MYVPRFCLCNTLQCAVVNYNLLAGAAGLISLQAPKPASWPSLTAAVLAAPSSTPTSHLMEKPTEIVWMMFGACLHPAAQPLMSRRGLPAAMMVPLVVLQEETMVETGEAEDQGHEGTTAGAPLEMRLETSWANTETHKIQWSLPAMRVFAGDALGGDRLHGEGWLQEQEL